ncbi:integrator complex subunit 3-like [Iris pallida]|uniref:Integrator complex subunit 3-like n=1 Tax=Iris pallida TaxID=29817 RepID=A0AAX6FXA8_IRIPA|nr:integrator complex subunit 3-like [Iris pallida]
MIDPSFKPSKLVKKAPHKAPDPLEISLQDSYSLCQPQLKPPFPLTIPSPAEYSKLNLAIAYGILTDPHHSKYHLTHLHSIVIDGYDLFATTLLSLSTRSYPELLDSPRSQLLYATNKLVQVSANKVDALLITLLRQIISGNVSETNLWLCSKLLEILMSNWDCLVDEYPMVVTSALFVFLRLLSDHYRLHGAMGFEQLKQMEIRYCIRVLKDCFSLCLQIGRDLVRLLQDLVHIPEFQEIWKGLLDNIVQLYQIRTPSRYFLLRISPEMEAQLRFLLTRVKFGSQKRYQAWFAKKHLCWPGSDTAIIDIVRFICCAHHPSNEIIQSDVISRWAVVGWFLKSCRKHYVEANVKLALFYDWLFFDEKVDNVMNIEPAMLLMIHSLPNYSEITHTLLEFLFLLLENYDVHRKEVIQRGVLAAFSVLVRKGVVPSLEPLTSSRMLAPDLRERLNALISSLNLGVNVNAPAASCGQQMEVDDGLCHTELTNCS